MSTDAVVVGKTEYGEGDFMLRLLSREAGYITAVFKRAKLHLGKPYNFSFYPQSDGFYCSEYIAEILPIFDTISMKFGDEENLISDFWQEYYRDLGLAVPLGQPGTNPSQLAQSSKLIYKGELHD